MLVAVLLSSGSVWVAVTLKVNVPQLWPASRCRLPRSDESTDHTVLPLRSSDTIVP